MKEIKGPQGQIIDAEVLNIAERYVIEKGARKGEKGKLIQIVSFGSRPYIYVIYFEDGIIDTFFDYNVKKIGKEHVSREELAKFIINDKGAHANYSFGGQLN